MRNAPLILSFSLLGLGLSASAEARIRYDRPINIITSNYDLVDTTYIDRGRLDGVKVGDKFEVKFRDGKLATQVMVTGVFERMASVKILDSWLLKDGQVGKFGQRPMVVALQNTARRPAPDITVKASSPTPAAAAPEASVAAPAAPDMPPAAPGGEPGMPAMPGSEMGLPGEPDAGLPAAPDAGFSPSPDGDMGLPPSPDAGFSPSPDGDMGLPAAPDAGFSGDPGADMGLPAAPDAGGDMGLPAAPDAGGMDIPPPPM